MVIVNLSQLVKFVLRRANLIFDICRAFDRLYIDEHRIQCKSTTGTVRARFRPSVIYRQQLDDIEIAELCPTGKRNQIKELTDADTLLAIEAKERNGYATLKIRNVTISHAANLTKCVSIRKPKNVNFLLFSFYILL